MVCVTLCLLIFFDDYSAVLIPGNSLRSVSMHAHIYINVSVHLIGVWDVQCMYMLQSYIAKCTLAVLEIS